MYVAMILTKEKCMLPFLAIDLWEFALRVAGLGVPEMVVGIGPFNHPVSCRRTTPKQKEEGR
jgi:hypothetical protein